MYVLYVQVHVCNSSVQLIQSGGGGGGQRPETASSDAFFLSVQYKLVVYIRIQVRIVHSVTYLHMVTIW